MRGVAVQQVDHDLLHTQAAREAGEFLKGALRDLLRGRVCRGPGVK